MFSVVAVLSTPNRPAQAARIAKKRFGEKMLKTT
jgi:hypothetical protein